MPVAIPSPFPATTSPSTAPHLIQAPLVLAKSVGQAQPCTKPWRYLPGHPGRRTPCRSAPARDRLSARGGGGCVCMPGVTPQPCLPSRPLSTAAGERFCVGQGYGPGTGDCWVVQGSLHGGTPPPVGHDATARTRLVPGTWGCAGAPGEWVGGWHAGGQALTAIFLVVFQPLVWSERSQEVMSRQSSRLRCCLFLGS